MEISKLKKWLSYIHDVHVETTSSSYNDYLHVLISKGRYQLCTPNAIYSYGDKYDNYRLSFEALDLERRVDQQVLVLGLGLGSIPYMLERVFNKRYDYTCVEIDPAVIALASKYVLDDLQSCMDIVQADAYIYVHSTSERYDIICVDLFIDDQIPEDFRDPSFLDALDEILAVDGVILFNHLSMTGRDQKLVSDYYREVFELHYPLGKALEVRGNRMLINDRRFLKS
jgi:spermidine synthase